MYGLRAIIDTMRMWASCKFALLVGGRNADDLAGAGRQLLEHRLARAAQQDRPQVRPQLVQVLVAQHLALLVHHAVAVEEAEGRRQPAVVDELDHRIQLVQPVLQRRAAEDQRERRAEALDDPGRLRLPVLDPLPFVQHDQVPADPLDGQDVAQHLFVVADGEEAVVVVLPGPLGGAAGDQLHAAVAKAVDLVAPLRFHRGGADHQHAADAGLAGQDLGRAHALDRLAQAHVVGQDRAADPRGKGDPFELIGEQLDLQQLLAQRVPRRVLPDLGHPVRHVPLEEPPLDQLLGVGVDRDGPAQAIHPLHAIHQPPHVLDRPVGQRAGRLDQLGIGVVGQLQVERDFLAVERVDEGLAVAVGLSPRRGGKTPPHAMQHVQDVLARAQRVRAEVGTRAVRIAPLFAPQRHAIALARGGAGDRVVGPRLPRIGRVEAELLGSRPFLAVAKGLIEQLLLVERFQRPPLVGRRGQAQRRLLLQHQRHGRADVLAERLAGGAVEAQPVPGLGHRGDGHDGRFSPGARPAQLQPEQVAAEIDVAVQVDLIVGRPLADQPRPVGPQQLGGLNVAQPGKPVFEGESLALLGLRSACLGLHDGRLLLRVEYLSQ